MMTPGFFKFMLNVYPPYLGTGIVVERVSDDFREVVVRMRLRWYNRNYYKTHFGGSLYTMVDPFYALMLIHILGKDYAVVDHSARIHFVKPGRGTVTARFRVDEERVADILEKTADGGKYLPEFSVEIVDEDGDVVARVEKVVYVRRRNGREMMGG